MIRKCLKDGTFCAVENGNVVGQPPANVRDKHFREPAGAKPSAPSTVPQTIQCEP